MSIIFVLIPLLAAFAIIAGGKGKQIALGAAGLNLLLGLGSLFCWKSEVWTLEWSILSKPNIHLATGDQAMARQLVRQAQQVDPNDPRLKNIQL